MINLRKAILSMILSIGVLGYVHTQELKYETDKYRYIPRGVWVKSYDLDGNGVPETYWWDNNNDREIQEEMEIFFDLNEDGIPDMNYFEFRDFIEKMKRKKQFKINYPMEETFV